MHWLVYTFYRSLSLHPQPPPLSVLCLIIDCLWFIQSKVAPVRPEAQGVIFTVPSGFLNLCILPTKRLIANQVIQCSPSTFINTMRFTASLLIL